MYLQDDFCTDGALLERMANSLDSIVGYNWWDGWKSEPPRTVWEEAIQYIWQREPGIVDQIAGFEYWRNEQVASGDFALGWHQDKDEVKYRTTKDVAHPAIGTIFYFYPHQLAGGCLELMPETWVEVPPDIPPIDDLERVRPMFNRLIIFDASRWHRVAPIVSGFRQAFLVNLWLEKPLTFQEQDIAVDIEKYLT